MYIPEYPHQPAAGINWKVDPGSGRINGVEMVRQFQGFLITRLNYLVHGETARLHSQNKIYR